MSDLLKELAAEFVLPDTRVPTEDSPLLQFPFLDLKAQYHTIKAEIDVAVQRVMGSQQFILGPEVDAFEKELATYTRTRFAIACASGSDALLLALMALDVGSGHEVITSPFTFIATAGAIARLRARPVFVDVDPDTYNIDPQKVRAAITPRTKAIIPIHLFGLPADMDPIMESASTANISVVEDAAQAIGARYKEIPVGGIGLCGCFSFFPSKNLGAAGDGGLLTTNDEKFADKLRILRNHGGHSKYECELIGMNSRLDALQAAILRIKLKYLDRWTESRKQNAERYSQLFNARGLGHILTLARVSGNGDHIYNQFVVRAPRRDQLKTYLREQGIPTDIYYPVPLHLQGAFAYLGHKPGDFPESERASREVLALPIYPELTAEQQGLIADAIAKFYS